MLAGAALSRITSAYRTTKNSVPSCRVSRPATLGSKPKKSFSRLFSSDQVDERFKKYGFEWPGAVRCVQSLLKSVPKNSPLGRCFRVLRHTNVLLSFLLA